MNARNEKEKLPRKWRVHSLKYVFDSRWGHLPRQLLILGGHSSQSKAEEKHVWNPGLKRWLCLFTCLASRAIHCEMAFGLDTYSFLNAFARMAYRRGLPQEVISDRGTNFISANRELKELVEKLDKHKICQRTSNQGVTWIFNPPQASQFGGAHEIMIKAAKRPSVQFLEKQTWLTKS